MTGTLLVIFVRLTLRPTIANLLERCSFFSSGVLPREMPLELGRPAFLRFSSLVTLLLPQLGPANLRRFAGTSLPISNFCNARVTPSDSVLLLRTVRGLVDEERPSDSQRRQVQRTISRGGCGLMEVQRRK